MAIARPILMLTVVILTLATAGCQQGGSPTPKLSELRIDYDEESGLLWFYLIGVEKNRFEALNLSFNGSKLTQVNVYVLARNTTADEVNLTAEALVGGEAFIFVGRVKLIYDTEDEKYQLEILTPDDDEPRTRNIPYTTILEKVSEK